MVFYFFAGIIVSGLIATIIFWIFFRHMFSIVNEGKMVANHLEELSKMAIEISDEMVGRRPVNADDQTKPNTFEGKTKHQLIYELYSQGYSVREISEQLHTEVDQVDLVIKLLEQNR